MIYSKVKIGCDPEFFIQNGGQVVGSESVLGGGLTGDRGTVIVDGVQAEINPQASTCREILIYNIHKCLQMVEGVLVGGNTANFQVSVDISPNMFSTLSEDCRKFGCKPSFNLDPEVPQTMQLNASEYMVRSAGGHFHLGGENQETFDVLRNIGLIIPTLDIVLGNTCVLLDRDKGNIERRKHYGRAGEFRTPEYGIEYRTLSNFWLRSPVLASFVFGMARHAVDMALNGQAKELLALVDYNDIRRAIDKNDFDLARKNFELVKDAILGSVEVGNTGRSPLDSESIYGFEKLVNKTIDRAFDADVLGNWRRYNKDTMGAYDYLTKFI